MVSTLKGLLILLALGYLGLVAAMYFWQRGLMYFPDPTRRTPSSVGFPEAEEVELRSADGERILAWHVPPQEGRPVVLYFQGNGGGLNLRSQRFRRITTTGLGLLALSYRGYGGSTGRPTEEGLLRDAAAAYDFAAARYPPERIVVWGESLGTGVAVALASEKPVARVLLESPFTSAVDVAAAVYFFIPVRLLMLDQFRSDLRIKKVSAPVLIVHGDRDITVPIRFGERLYSLINAPKKFIRLPNAGHNDHDAHGAFDLVKDFLVRGLE